MFMELLFFLAHVVCVCVCEEIYINMHIVYKYIWVCFICVFGHVYGIVIFSCTCGVCMCV